MQAIKWWEKAAQEALRLGMEPAQALRYFLKADAAAELISGYLSSVLDSAASLSGTLGSTRFGRQPPDRCPILSI